MNKIIGLIFMSQLIVCDVLLVNVINLAGNDIDILFDNKVIRPASAVNSLRLAPYAERTGLNIDLFSKKTTHPTVIRVPNCKDFQYSPSGDTLKIDLILDYNAVKVVPSGPNTKLLAKRMSGVLIPGRDWIFDSVKIMSVENKSSKQIQVNSGGKRYQERPVVLRRIEVAPHKKEMTNIALDRGQELVIYINEANGKQQRAEYVPTGKSESLEIMIDDHGTPFVKEEHLNERRVVPFEDSKRLSVKN
jgi:hypothetical protein